MNNKTPPEIEEFASKAIPLLTEYGLIKNRSNLLLIIVVVILGFSFLGLLFYSLQIDAFKSEINQSQDVLLEPQTDIDVNNEYEFKPLTTNNFKNNYTIDLPENLCTCICG